MANKTRVVNKHDTSTNWAKAKNFIPLEGEIVFYSDLNKIKIGDGKTNVDDLNFLGESATKGKLTIGDFSFDGSQDINIPIYKGENSDGNK